MAAGSSRTGAAAVISRSSVVGSSAESECFGLGGGYCEGAHGSISDAGSGGQSARAAWATAPKRRLLTDALVWRMQVFADMEEEGVQPDTQTFNTLLRACHMAGDYYKALRMRQRMRALGVQPDAFTFSILIHGCAKSNPPKVRVPLACHNLLAGEPHTTRVERSHASHLTPPSQPSPHATCPSPAVLSST